MTAAAGWREIRWLRVLARARRHRGVGHDEVAIRLHGGCGHVRLLHHLAGERVTTELVKAQVGEQVEAEEVGVGEAEVEHVAAAAIGPRPQFACVVDQAACRQLGYQE